MVEDTGCLTAEFVVTIPPSRVDFTHNSIAADPLQSRCRASDILMSASLKQSIKTGTASVSRISPAQSTKHGRSQSMSPSIFVAVIPLKQGQHDLLFLPMAGQGLHDASGPPDVVTGELAPPPHRVHGKMLQCRPRPIPLPRKPVEPLRERLSQWVSRNTTKGVLRGEYHFAKVYIWDKSTDQTEQRLLVIRKTTSGKGTVEIKYSFTNANLEQYEPEGLAYMQAERYFIEHSIKESKHILGMDQFQTRKWLAWQHQIALNFLVSSFILKEKLQLFEEMPLLSARDVKEMVVRELYEQMTQDQMMDRINKRHAIRQEDINRHYKKKSNLSK